MEGSSPLHLFSRKMGLTEEIRQSIGTPWGKFTDLLTKTLESKSILLNRINSYLLEASGKQLRPLLAMLTAKACSGFINDKAVACAAVSELIHTATLLHDDVVDDSDLRRGRPTVKKLFSSGASLLIGDYWLTRAIHLLISNQCPYSVLSTYSKALEHLSEGEMMQMEFSENLLTSEQDYFEIIKRKTASLFVASVKGAAIVSEADDCTVQELEDFAYGLGCCFQIRDDIIDYYPESVTGKDSNSDILERKITMPLLCALEAAPEADRAIRSRMGEITMMPADRESDLKIAGEIRSFVMEKDGIGRAKTKLADFLKSAKSHLAVLPQSDQVRYMESIADYIGRL